MSRGPTETDDQVDLLVDRALGRDRLSISRLVSIFEDQRADAPLRRRRALRRIDRDPRCSTARSIGITGTPGSGKSTLVGRLAEALLRLDSGLTVAVLAIDPSSHISGGALLGDRTRVKLQTDDARFFFRSQASQTALGGLSPQSYQVCRLLVRLFDCVFIETVGIGQSEVDIRYLADRVYLVMQPLGGDEVQFLKAGIMEIPDSFVLNKADQREAAQRSYHALKASLALARPFDSDAVTVFRTSAVSGEGIAELTDEVVALLGADSASMTTSRAAREAYFFERWVAKRWGERGLEALRQAGGAAGTIEAAGSLDDAQLAADEQILRWLSTP